MLDSRLVESIKTLTQSEKAEFASFLDTRFFQREFSIQQLKQLLSMILKALSDPKGFRLTRESVHKEVFLTKAFAENRMDRIMFELNRLLKTFLLIKHYLRDENEVAQILDWSEVQRGKGLETGYEKQLQKLEKEIEEKSKSSAKTYFERYLIAKEEHEWQSTFNKAKGDLGLPKAMEALDFFYYTERLEMHNRFLLQQRFSSVESSGFMKMSLEIFSVPEYFLDQSRIILITGKIHQLLKDPHPKIVEFEELMTLLQKYELDLPPEMLAQFYAYLRNFCTFLIDAGHTEFDGLLHDIQRDNLERGYFYYEGKIPPNALLSIIQQAIRAQKSTWAREFLQSQKDRIIGEADTQEFYRMNEALCLFAENKFEEALVVIPFGSANAAYHLMARRLELKIYFEMHSEVLPSKIDAFKMFVNRIGNKSLSPSLTEMLTNFGNFVHQLSLSLPGDKKRSDQLLRRIQDKKLVGERNWLLEKARELAEAKL